MTVEQLIARLMEYDLQTEVEIVTTDKVIPARLPPISWTIDQVTETITHKRKWDPPYDEVVYILQGDEQAYLHPQAQSDLGLRE